MAAARPAIAYPEGAPWGAADPDAPEHCASCHWERDPVYDSAALALTGLPQGYTAGQTYTLTITLQAMDAAVSGFQFLAMADGQLAGALHGPTEHVERAALGTGVRSVAATALQDGVARWTITWRAPDADGDIEFRLAAMAGNDDQSPFGDQVHYRRFSVPALTPAQSASRLPDDSQ